VYGIGLINFGCTRASTPLSLTEFYQPDRFSGFENYTLNFHHIVKFFHARTLDPPSHSEFLPCSDAWPSIPGIGLINFGCTRASTPLSLTEFYQPDRFSGFENYTLNFHHIVKFFHARTLDPPSHSEFLPCSDAWPSIPGIGLINFGCTRASTPLSLTEFYQPDRFSGFENYTLNFHHIVKFFHARTLDPPSHSEFLPCSDAWPSIPGIGLINFGCTRASTPLSLTEFYQPDRFSGFENYTLNFHHIVKFFHAWTLYPPSHSKILPCTDTWPSIA